MLRTLIPVCLLGALVACDCPGTRDMIYVSVVDDSGAALCIDRMEIYTADFQNIAVECPTNTTCEQCEVDVTGSEGPYQLGVFVGDDVYSDLSVELSKPEDCGLSAAEAYVVFDAQ